MRFHCPFRVTSREANAIYASTQLEDYEFYTEETIAEGDYKKLMEYIEARPNASVCIRVFGSNNCDVLQLPITKTIIILMYLEDTMWDENRLAAVMCYQPTEHKFAVAWKVKGAPRNMYLCPDLMPC